MSSLSSPDPNSDHENLYRAVLLFGAPGCGKGTQGTRLGNLPQFFHSASGEAFRNLKPQSPMGRLFHEYASRGELVPDEATLQIWSQAIAQQICREEYRPDRQLLILDGIPRTVRQVGLLAQFVDVLRIIHLTCDDTEAMFERIRGRASSQDRNDDVDEHVIRRRWEVYQNQTMPVLAQYPQDLITTIDAMGTMDQVHEQILQIVEPIQTQIAEG